MDVATREAEAHPQRTLSITFDDGFLEGSRTARKILGDHGLKATFYVVTGWVEPKRSWVRDRLNAGHSHGDWNHWRQMAAEGHEIGGHSFSHLNASGRIGRLFPWFIRWDIRQSRRDLARYISEAPCSTSMPWNATSPQAELEVSRNFLACRLGGSALTYNDTRTLDRFRIGSWAPRPETTLAQYIEAIEQTPPHGWLVLQFHSFGDEGYDPIPAEIFEGLCAYAAKALDLRVATVETVIRELDQTGSA